MRDALDSIVIEARGTLDVFLAQRFADAALHCADAGLDTTLECIGLERIDASAIQVLLALRKGLRATYHDLRLSNLPQNVANYIELAGLGALLTSAPPGSQAAGERENHEQDGADSR